MATQETPGMGQPEEEADQIATAPEQPAPLVETETRLQIEIKHREDKGEQEAEKLLLKAAKRETTKLAEAEEVLQEVEHEARHVITRAETHETVQIALVEAKTFANFWLKFLNDWAFNFASGLAYHLLMAMFPVVIVLLLFIGFLSKNPSNQQHLLDQLNTIFPNILINQNVLDPALDLIRKDAGFLGVLALLLAIFNGSRLFTTIENCFAVIYHTPARSFWRQNLMALLMLLAFILLIPIMLLASSIGLGGFFGGIVASWLLFEAMYMFIPNQHISLRNSWPGALIAAIALQIYIALFPAYVRHFLGSYTGTAGFAIILLLFFYYFAIILLVGAEVNAFYAEDIRGTPTDIAGLVRRATLEADQQKLAELVQEKSELRSLKR
jgi:YihY family inner membrane protein